MRMRTETRTPDGRQIIAREPALIPHPHPKMNGKLVPFAGVTKVLLDDETEQYECDECGKLFATGRSATAHMPSHREREPMYSPDVIRHVVREVKIALRDGRRNYMQVAAARLNEAQVPTVKGNPWTTGAVSNVYLAYKDQVRVRIPGERVVAAQVVRSAQELTNGFSTSDTARRAADVVLAVRRICADLAELGDVVEKLGQAIVALPAVDEQTVADARKFRELQKLMGGGE